MRREDVLGDGPAAVFSGEPAEFTEKRREARELTRTLDMPESIRTPGRTWTRYPDIKPGPVEVQEPDVEVTGEVEVFTGAEALREAGEGLMAAVKTGENRLTALHTALANSAVYVRISGEAEVSVVHRTDSTLSAHLVVDAERSSEVSITEEFRGSPELLTSVTELYLSENASLTYGAIESADSGFSYSRRKAVVERDASVNWLNAVFGGELSRTKMETVLKGDNSSTEKRAVWYPVGDQHIDVSLHAYHRGENTSCDMDSSAVVDDRARSVYEGMQKVDTTADDTKSFQNENVLILSDKAEVDASPKLMIEDPDVEASHAASAGRLDPEQLYYMKSRGITEEEAVRLAVKGFFEPVMAEISLPLLKESIREHVDKKLQR